MTARVRKLHRLFEILTEAQSWTKEDIHGECLAAACIADNTLDLAQVSIATLDRYIWLARALTPNNVVQWVRTWQRLREVDPETTTTKHPTVGPSRSRHDSAAHILERDMRTIWKYTIALRDGHQKIEMPQGSVFLHLGMQGSHLAMWFDVRSEVDTATRTFVVHGTGHPVYEGSTYLATTVASGLVWHLFEVGT